MKVVYGILLSTLLGFGLGWFNFKVIGALCRNMDRMKTTRFFRGAQVVSGAGVAFMHGAQDGQKFMSIFVLAVTLALGVGQVDQMILPVWLMIFCALNMSIGRRWRAHHQTVGVDAKLERSRIRRSLSTFACLMLSTFGGLPVSTTHTNTTAIMGVGAARNPKAVKWSIAVDMVKTWVLTFPGCGLMGFAFAWLFLAIL
ncbi:MAG: anion permease [Eggerthellaceae bacterium]